MYFKKKSAQQVRGTSLTQFVFLLLLLFGLAVLCKYMQFYFLPPKYFYDSKAILSLSLSSYYHTQGDSYSFTGNVFRFINILKLNTLEQWAIALAIIMNLALFVFLLKRISFNVEQLFFVISSLTLLNIYVFNISKDVLQFAIFGLVYFMIVSQWAIVVKVIGIVALFSLEAVIFRSYYILMAGLFLIVFIRLSRQAKTKETFIQTVIILFLTAVIGVYFIKTFTPQSYLEITLVRARVNAGRIGSSDANTIILDLIDSHGSVFLYLFNYLINAIRLMLPFELLFKGIQYIPFIIYQLFLTYRIIYELHRLKYGAPQKQIMLAAVVCAYYLVSFLFEPDFGSFVRHESTLFVLLYSLFFPASLKAKRRGYDGTYLHHHSYLQRGTLSSPMLRQCPSASISKYRNYFSK